MSLADELKKIVRGEVTDDNAALEKDARDASLFYVKPEVIVAPQDAQDVCTVVDFVNKKVGEIQKDALAQNAPRRRMPSITARSAGTDMGGGPLSDSIILDMTAHLNKFISIEGDEAVVEPGMYFRDFDKETQKQGLELPSYTASRELNTVGGMAANNSGGEKNLKYGKTARWVEELDVVLSDGQVHTLKKYQGLPLIQKLQGPGFEGDIYRAVAALVSAPAHARIVAEHKPTVSKNSSGYALWDIGDGKSSLNLARLMVGAQGTLGIITKIKYKLVHPQPFSSMVVMFVDELAQLGQLVPEVLKYQPDSFESYDDHTFAIALKYLPELAGQMKSGLVGLGISFLPELFMLLRGGLPKLVLLAEFRGDTQTEALQKAQTLADEIRGDALESHGVKASPRIRIAKNEKAARKYWAVRRESFNLLRKKIRGKRTAPFIDDFVVPPNTLPEFLPKLQTILAQYPQLTYTIAGHVGDGNFHIIPLVDPNDPTLGKVIDELSHKTYDLVLQYKGSITGEHNDGIVRTPYVEKMFGPEMYALFLEIKKIFDPHDIFNPGKKVGGTFSDALTKLDLPSVKNQQSK